MSSTTFGKYRSGLIVLVLSTAIIVRTDSFRFGKCDALGHSAYYEESIDWLNSRRIIISSGCPNHFSVCQTEDCGGDLVTLAQPQNFSIQLPLYPEFAISSPDTTCMTGMVGVSLNGVSIEGMQAGLSVCLTPEEANWSGAIKNGRINCNLHGDSDGILYCGDSVVRDASIYDKCGGHVDHVTGAYHYNIPPSCLINQLQQSWDGNGHSPQIGWALDGFPIYGPLGPNGAVMQRCTSDSVTSNTYCLDGCNGLKADLPHLDAFRYRYYVTGPVATGECSKNVTNAGQCQRLSDPCCSSVVPPIADRPYTIGCFAGCPTGLDSCHLSGERGTIPDYLPMATRPSTAVISKIVIPTSPSPQQTPAPAPSPVEVVPNPKPSAEAAAIMQQKSPVMTNTTVAVRVSADLGGGLGLLSPSKGLELLPVGPDDAFMAGLAVDTLASCASHVLGGPYLTSDFTAYFACTSGLYSTCTVAGAVPVPVVSGIFTATIVGYNFASLSVSVAGLPCLGVSRQSHTHNGSQPLETLHCVISSISARSPPTVADVSLASLAGNFRGADLIANLAQNPEEAVTGRTRRPAVLSIDISAVPFRPYAVAVPESIDPQNPVHVAADLLYWSNPGLGAIHRSTLHGLQKGLLETVASGVGQVYALVVLSGSGPASSSETCQSSDSEGADTLLFSSPRTASVRRLLAQRCPALSSELLTQADRSVAAVSGLTEIRGLAVDTKAGIAVVSLLGGDVYRISLALLLAANGANIVSLPQSQARRLLSAPTNVRLDGVSILSGLSAPLWDKERIFVADFNMQRLWFLRDAGGSSYMSFGRNGALTDVALPRSLWVRKIDQDTVEVTMTEFLGRIWRMTLSLQNGLIAPDSRTAPALELLLDWSSFAASERLRSEMAFAASNPGNLFFEIPL